jgi:hypothetical protein
VSPLALSFSVLALVPAAVDPSLLLRGETLTVTLCGGGTASIPLDNPLPGSNNAVCCAKGCRSSEKRRNRLAF